jgi:hypothetical protein
MPRRRALLVLPLLAGCGGGDDAKPVSGTLPPGPIDYRYLTPLPLNVAAIEMAPAVPPTQAGDIGGRLAPTPAEAVRTMGRDRLVAAGTTGQATFTVAQATLLQASGSLQCLVGCRLDVFDAEGERRGFVEAQARRNRTGSEANRAGMPGIVLREAMDELNVEFEFQVRRAVKDWLVQAAPSEGVVPAPVEKEELPRS